MSHTHRINDFLLANGIRITSNPAISPDFCLDWPHVRERLLAGDLPDFEQYPASVFTLGETRVALIEEPETGDHAWLVREAVTGLDLDGGAELNPGLWAYPATWNNLLRLKNLIQEVDPLSTIFPSASGSLATTSLGVGARFTTLHWPAVDWTMAQLGISLTANQNSIPRELVFDVEPMLDGALDTCRFPFIGADVPEGHQGQSVEGMSHGAVLAKLKYGFHNRRLPWGFNADHQPVGGKYDEREAALVRGSVLATYITFDLSPELMATPAADAPRHFATIPPTIVETVRQRLQELGLAMAEEDLAGLLGAVWPAMQKMQRRDRAYAAARAQVFTTDIGRRYFRELSIDELPGLTTPATLAAMLALSEALEMPVQFVAPAFGFQKNFPFPDNAALRERIAAAWEVCRAFGVSIGFHSGSGKSAENYRVCGEVTGGRLEIKTSGRYTYEMGVALAASPEPADQALWQEWYAFTRELAIASAFSEDATERDMARSFIVHALDTAGRSSAVFAEAQATRQALEALDPSPDHMFWFEYNFLFILAAGGRPDKASLGDHGPQGYAQRARFYSITPAAKLAYSRRVAEYLCFLAEHTGMATAEQCQTARDRLAGYCCYGAFLGSISG